MKIAELETRLLELLQLDGRELHSVNVLVVSGKGLELTVRKATKGDRGCVRMKYGVDEDYCDLFNPPQAKGSMPDPDLG